MVRAVVMAFALILLLPASAAADGRWLDAPLTRWNQTGAAIPAPPPDALRNETCRSSERAATEPAERALVGRGWRLVSFWPTIKAGAALLVPGLAFYDGMCRPLQYNVFIFVDGDKYAGTLSPALMDSRTDGALFGAPSDPGYGVKSDGTIAARFARYRATDPLCCPTGGVTEATYRIEAQTVVGVAAQAIPAALPRTGSGTTWLPIVGLGVLALGAGIALRRSA